MKGGRILAVAVADVLQLSWKKQWRKSFLPFCMANTELKCRPVHSSLLATASPQHGYPWASQPMVSLMEREESVDSVIIGSTLEDRQRSAQLLFDMKKEAYLAELQKFGANSHAVFTNSEFSLKYVDVYGFDLDYTLVQYTSELHKFMYKEARDTLIRKLNYPSFLKDLNYDPDFAIRGLHCDSKNGLLMKIDAYNQIQVGSVYRGHSAVSTDELVELYGSLHVPMHVMDHYSTSSKWNLTQFLDMFSLPEATLYADVSQFLMEHSINYDPGNLYKDIQDTICELHVSGKIHNEILSDVERYLVSHHQLPHFLNKLKASGKELFIITNSPYFFLNKMLTYLLESSQWQDVFDVVIVGARKPSFYSTSHRPFRLLNSASMTPTWTKVTELCAGMIYQQGNIQDLVHMMQWHKKGVLYFGDHVFSDLAEPILQHGWKTGAIIPELEHEINCGNSSQFKLQLSRLLALESVLKNVARLDEKIVEQWKAERNSVRRYLKEAHNARFGSVFRTVKSPTYFTRRLASFSNLYTSSLDNLLQYSLSHTFIPRRAALPHEPDLNFDL